MHSLAKNRAEARRVDLSDAHRGVRQLTHLLSGTRVQLLQFANGGGVEGREGG